MNQDRLADAAETLAGRAVTATGGLLRDESMISSGRSHQKSGKHRNVIGSIRDMLGLPARRTVFGKPFVTKQHGKDSIMNEDEIKGGLRYVKGKVEKGVGDVTTDTKWQADGVIDQIAGGAQNLYGRAKDRVQDVIDDAPDTLADVGERVRDVAERGRAVANDKVEDNPWLLIAVAGLAGYALSWMLHGRRD